MCEVETTQYPVVATNRLCLQSVCAGTDTVAGCMKFLLVLHVCMWTGVMVLCQAVVVVNRHRSNTPTSRQSTSKCIYDSSNPNPRKERCATPSLRGRVMSVVHQLTSTTSGTPSEGKPIFKKYLIVRVESQSIDVIHLRVLVWNTGTTGQEATPEEKRPNVQDVMNKIRTPRIMFLSPH